MATKSLSMVETAGVLIVLGFFIAILAIMLLAVGVAWAVWILLLCLGLMGLGAYSYFYTVDKADWKIVSKVSGDVAGAISKRQGDEEGDKIIEVEKKIKTLSKEEREELFKRLFKNT